MKKLSIIICIIVLLLITGCHNNKKTELEEILEHNNYIIVDVRTNEEYLEGHIKESINIPYDIINEATNLDKNKTIMVYCRSGKRSAIAYNKLKELGYNVYDLGAFNEINLEKE